MCIRDRSCPDAATVGVNVVDPQSMMVRWPAVEIPVMVNVGSFNTMVSAGEWTRRMLRANVKAITVGASVTGVSILSTLCMNSGVAGFTTAVDNVIAVVLAIFLASASVTPTFRDASLALCSVALVVTPVSIATVHRVSASIAFDAAVSVRVAVAVPEFATVTVLPNAVASPSLHPSITTGADGVPANVNVGNTRSIVSPTFSGAFISNEYVIADATSNDGRWIVRLLCVSTGSSTAVDTSIAAAPILPVASVPATVRVFRFAVCVTLLAVTPLGTLTVHGS